MDLKYLLIILVTLVEISEQARVSNTTRSQRKLSRTPGSAPRSFCNRRYNSTPASIARVNTQPRLQELRSAMKKVELIRGAAVDAYIITSDDEHQSEAVAARDQRRLYMTGFSGTRGDVVVTQTMAVLWTDARYFLQADVELGCYWQIMRTGIEKVPSMVEWIHRELKPGDRVGADPRLIPHYVWETWEHDLAKSNLTLVPIYNNLVDHVWRKNRPEFPKDTAVVHDIKFSGENWTSKVHRVRDILTSVGAQALVVTALDDIAWLLNIRGRDAPFTPVVRAYVLVSIDYVDMFVPGGNLPESVRLHLRSDDCLDSFCVRLRRYEDIWASLKTMAQLWDKVLVPAPFSYSNGASHAIASQIPPDKRLSKPSPIMLMKAVKNRVEIEGMRQSHVRDAAAVCLFMAYFEETMNQGEVWTEEDVARAVDRFRYDQPLSRGASFQTIAAYEAHSAQPHFRPGPSNAVKIGNRSTFVLDSGGQYLDGTTDVTRTFHFGTPNELQKEAYTRVLAGVLSLSKAVFPTNMDTADLDILARGPLWTKGMDYRHGTGHGVGSYMSVHEAPLAVNYNSKYRKSFEVGHFFSVEPGYYHEYVFGIRIENVLEVVQVKTNFNVTGPYLGFRTATLVPYEPKLIDIDLLSPEMRRWINEYNARIRTEVGHELKKRTDMKGFRWMMSKTGYIPEWAPPKKSSAIQLTFHWYMCFMCVMLMF